jgi:hypothetical protein
VDKVFDLVGDRSLLVDHPRGQSGDTACSLFIRSECKDNIS